MMHSSASVHSSGGSVVLDGSVSEGSSVSVAGSVVMPVVDAVVAGTVVWLPLVSSSPSEVEPVSRLGRSSTGHAVAPKEKAISERR